MPYKDPEQQARYYREREERRKTDPEYIAKRKASFAARYADPEFRENYQQYQSNYKKNRRATDPEYRMREREASRWGGRKYTRGIKFTPEQQAAFEALQMCEICAQETGKQLHMDHCHDCGQYRGGLCARCNTHEGVLRKWQATCPPDSPMWAYLNRHICEVQ